MNKVAASISIIFLCTYNIYADRALFTSEMVEYSTIIGTWEPENLNKQENDVLLTKPSRLFKGDPNLLEQITSYSPRLNKAMEKITNRGLILFITIRNGRADLVSDIAYLPFDGITNKVVSNVIAQLKLSASWDKLALMEQIENSDIIFTGAFSDFGKPWEEDLNPTLIVDTTFRGIASKEIVILPQGVKIEDGRFLFFVQRYYGTGPDYMLFHHIPIENASKYLDILTKRTLQ